MSRSYPAKAILKQKLTVEKLAEKLEGLSKDAVIGFAIHTDQFGEPKETVLLAEHDGKETNLWVWTGFDK